jgi:hypothetical protein
MEQKPEQAHVNTKKTNKTLQVIPWVGLILFVVLAVIGGYLYATKKLVFASASTDASVSVVTRACGKDVIAKYNGYYTADAPDAQKATLKSAFDAATATSGAADDPNCAYIRYAYYFATGDTANAQKEIDSLKALAAKGQYATSELTGVQQLDSIQADLNRLKNPNAETQGTTSTNGQG